MANKRSVKLRIDSDLLRNCIQQKKLSIRAIGRKGVYSEKTIRRGLKSDELSIDVALYLSETLNVPVCMFAYVDDFVRGLYEIPLKNNIEKGGNYAI